MERIVALPESVKQKDYAEKKDVPSDVLVAANTIAENFAQDTIIHLASCFLNRRMYVMSVYGEENAKRIEPTTSPSKQMLWQGEDIPIPDAKIQTRGEELERLDELVSPLILKGQPLTHIWSEHGEELGISQRTLYRYIDQGVLSVGNIDLRRKVAYKPRKKKKEVSEGFLNQEFRKNRGYDDYLKYMEKHPDTPIIQMDTVKGCREQGKRLLTLHFCNTNMMLMLLMRDGKADTVVEQFDMLTGLLGLEEFRKVFPVILTDNGSEFKHTRDLETTEDGKKRTKVFYCDPQASWQKPQIEKNHEFIRYVLPKGKTLNPYTQEDMLLLANNINSIRRESLGNKSPYEATTDKSILRLMELMGLHTVPADEVNLTPALLKR